MFAALPIGIDEREARIMNLQTIGGIGLGSVGLGAAAMYALDPRLGHRRRAMARQKLVGMSHDTGDFLHAAVNDLRHRTRGVVAETRCRMRSRHGVDDELL